MFEVIFEYLYVKLYKPLIEWYLKYQYKKFYEKVLSFKINHSYLYNKNLDFISKHSNPFVNYNNLGNKTNLNYYFYVELFSINEFKCLRLQSPLSDDKEYFTVLTKEELVNIVNYLEFLKLNSLNVDSYEHEYYNSLYNSFTDLIIKESDLKL